MVEKLNNKFVVSVNKNGSVDCVRFKIWIFLNEQKKAAAATTPAAVTNQLLNQVESLNESNVCLFLSSWIWFGFNSTHLNDLRNVFELNSILNICAILTYLCSDLAMGCLPHKLEKRFQSERKKCPKKRCETSKMA